MSLPDILSWLANIHKAILRLSTTRIFCLCRTIYSVTYPELRNVNSFTRSKILELNFTFYIFYIRHIRDISQLCIYRMYIFKMSQNYKLVIDPIESFHTLEKISWCHDFWNQIRKCQMFDNWIYSCHSLSSSQGTCPPPAIKASMLCATIKQFTTSARWFLGNTECTSWGINPKCLEKYQFSADAKIQFLSVLRQMVWLCWFYEYEPGSRRSQGSPVWDFVDDSNHKPAGLDIGQPPYILRS